MKTISLNQELEKGKTESANLRQQVKTLADEKASLSEELAKGKTEISTLEEKLEKAEHKITNEEFDRLAEISGLKQKITGLNQQLDKRAAEIGTVQQTLTKKEMQNLNLNKELAKERTEINKLKQEIRKVNSEKAGLSQELDKGKSEITNLKQEVKSLAEQKSDLERVTDTVAGNKSSLKERVLELESMNKSLEQEGRKLKMELQREKDQRRGKDDHMETLEVTIQEQKQLLESQHARFQNTQEDLYEKRKSINFANEENTKLVKEMKTMEQRLKTQTGQVRGDGKKLQEVRNELKNLKEHHEKTMKDLQSNVARLTMRVQSQPKTEVNEMKKEFAATVEVNKRMEIEIDLLRTEMSGLEAELLKVQYRADRAQEKLRHYFGNKDTEKAEAAGEKTDAAGETTETAGKKTEVVREKAEAAGEKTDTAGEKTDTAGEKTETAGKKTEVVGKKAEVAGEKTETDGKKAEAVREKIEAAGEKPETAGKKTGVVGEKAEVAGAKAEAAKEKPETAGEKIKTSHEDQIKQQKAASDAPTAEHLAVARNHEPAVAVIEPKLPNAEAEAKGQESKTGLFELTKAEIAELTRLQRGNENTSGTTEAETVMNANALEKADDLRKQKSQAGDPFTEAHVSLKAPAELFDEDYDVSSSSVCSNTELSIDNQTPRALRRPLGHEGIHSRRHSTATDLSVTKCERWIDRISNYVEKHTQTESMVLMEDMGMQTENVPAKLPIGMMLGKGVGVQTEVVPIKMQKGKESGVKKGSEPKMKEETVKFRQTRRYLLMSSFIHLLMLLFYLGMCYLAWSSWAATTAERDLWTRTNSAVAHGARLFDNGSYPPSAISETFYRKK